ncbi:MFS transporter [Kouleothrix sp.]|uniref:MFS transporter n=1 Tax=Kouleothrix sp. TaxID=2779161 RepID=UPI00391C88F9
MIGARSSARWLVPQSFIFVTVFVDMLGYGIVIPLLPIYAGRLAAGGTLVGLLGSLYALAQSAGGPVLSGMSDQYGRRPVLLVSLLGTTLAYLLLGVAGSLWLLAAAILLDGITGGNISTAQAYIADSTDADRRSRGFAATGAAFGLGMMAGPALGGLLIRYGLSVPVFVAAAIAGANTLLGLLLLPESLAPEHRARRRLADLNPARQLAAALRPGSLRGLLLTILLLNLAFSGLQSNFPLFSRARFGWQAADNAFFYAFVGTCAVATQAVALGWLRPRLGERRLALGGLALMAANLGLVAVAGRGWMLFPIVALLALGSNLSIPCLTSMLSARVAPGGQGQLMGSMQIVINLALVGGPLLAGLSFDYLGDAAPYALGSLVALAALWAGARATKTTL